MSLMPTCWVIKKEELESRFDAEYYQPEYLEIERLINKIKKNKLFDVKSLKDITLDIRKGIFYILASEYVEEGIPFIRVSNLKHPLLDDSELVYISEERNKENIKTCLSPGDLAISKSGYLGLVSIIPPHIKKCNVSQDVIAVKMRKEYISEYVLCFLLTKYGKKQLERGRTQVTQSHLELMYVRKLQIVLPSQEFQLKIKQKITKAEELNSKILNLRLELKKLSKDLGLEVPEVKGGENFKVRKENLLNRLDPEFYYYGERIPEIFKKYPYEIKFLDTLVDFSSKRINPRKKPDKQFRYVEIADVNSSLGEIESFSEILGAEAPGRARMLLRAGNVILSRLRGSLKSIAIVPEELDGSIGTTGFIVLQPKEEIINKESLWWVLRTGICQRQLEQIASGAIMAAVNEKELRKLQVPIPPPDAQKEIKIKVEEIQKLKREVNRLMKEAVNEVEKLIEESIK